MGRIVSFARDLLSPPFCLSCGNFLSSREHLCAWCSRGIIPPATCTIGVTHNYAVKVHALSSYEGVVRKLILSKNYKSPIQSHQLGELMAASNFCPWDQFDCIVAIPLHWSRYSWRGFNQALVMARAIGARHCLPVQVLARRRGRTVQQTTLAHADRQKNVKDVFVLRPGAAQVIMGKRILIVDDVMTTGATIRALACTLAAGQPDSITAVVAARVL